MLVLPLLCCYLDYEQLTHWLTGISDEVTAAWLVSPFGWLTGYCMSYLESSHHHHHVVFVVVVVVVSERIMCGHQRMGNERTEGGGEKKNEVKKSPHFTKQITSFSPLAIKTFIINSVFGLLLLLLLLHDVMW